MTKTDKVVHAIRTFRNLDDLVPLLAWHVDKTRRARYTGTEWLKSHARWRLVIRRGPTFGSCGIPGSNLMTTQELSCSWFGLFLGPAH